MHNFGRVTVCLERREVFLDGQPHTISTRAFDILEVLIRADGKLVTKDALLDAVWPDTVVVDNNVQVHISSLRKLFGGKDGCIRTQSGRGYRLVNPSLQSVPATRPVTPAPAPQAMTTPRTPLIGRERVIEALVSLLGARPLVTLVGPGGIGKTAVSHELARRCAAEPGMHVCFVDLGSAISISAGTPPGAVAEAIAAQIAPSWMAATVNPPRKIDALCEMIGDRTMTLILDNCEHVIDDVATVCQAICTFNEHVKIIATSREPLRIAPEQIYRLQPLDTPPPESGDTEILASPAAQLFLTRAESLGSHFPRDARTLDAVARLCRRLGGMPLALELAAARATSIGIETLVDDPDANLLGLPNPLRSVSPRHKTIRSAIDWSFQLLGEHEQLALTRLATLEGRFGFEAACAAAICPFVDRRRLPDIISDLILKSLVIVDPHASVDRYYLPEMTREYALEKRAEATEPLLPEARRESSTVSVMDRLYPALTVVKPPFPAAQLYERVIATR